MNKAKLTIIIPCYNCEQTLKEAVDSIYEQNFDITFEIIMVDDKSTDRTREVMNNLSKKYSEISLFYHDENKGGGATRNTAVQNSSGDIIFCLDSDDVLPPNTLPKMYKYLLNKECDGVSFSTSLKFKGGDLDDIAYTHNFGYVDQKIPIHSLFEVGTCGLYSVFMFTRKSFDLIGGYPENHGFDTQGFAFRFLLKNQKAYTCPEAFYKQRIKFNRSYYLREYHSGKVNYNWQKIFLEHYYIFNNKTLNFIKKFNCKDFTNNLLDELSIRENIFIPNFESILDERHPKLNFKPPKPTYIKINSLKGILFRLRKKIKKNSKMETRSQMKKILKKIISTCYGKTKFQKFFSILHKLSLRGMNYGIGDVAKSGEIFALKKLKENIHKPVIFDVGANQGQYANLINQVFKGESILYCFEPSSFAFGKLKENTKGINNITINNFGFGSTNKEEILHYEEHGSGLASIYKRDLQHFNIHQDMSENICIQSIDSFCEGNNIERIDFLKIDVEGYELEVLNGAKKMIDDLKIETIQFEFGGCNIDSKTYFIDFFRLLSEKYNIYRLLQNGLQEIKEYSEDKEVFLNINYIARLKNK